MEYPLSKADLLGVSYGAAKWVRGLIKPRSDAAEYEFSKSDLLGIAYVAYGAAKPKDDA